MRKRREGEEEGERERFGVLVGYVGFWMSVVVVFVGKGIGGRWFYLAAP